ncbi:DUF1133 family protein [Erwinia sp. BNK-24-b]|uniref:DUF1133 family protein n=1 Tax=unclassified Erwinia TaxID=2622719 RepID=UPI0039BF8B43
MQSKLKMWGRWAMYSDMPEAVNMFKRVLASGKVTQEDLKRASISSASLVVTTKNLRLGF